MGKAAVLATVMALAGSGCTPDTNFPVDTSSSVDTSETGVTDTGDTATTLPQCSDGIDNDEDGLTDAIDPECFNEDGVPDGTINQEASQCGDGVDNNSNGYTDQADPGCWRDALDPDSYEPTDIDESTVGFQAPSYPEGWVDTGDTGTTDDTALLLNNTRKAVDQTWAKIVDLRVS